MKNSFALLSGVLAVVATLPYIVNALRGLTRPNVVTWFTWALLNGLTALAALSGGAGHTTVFAGASAACCAVVTALGLRYGFERYTRFDAACQLLAVVGVAAWYISGNPAVDVVVNVAAGLVALLPTYRHGWARPYEETLLTWILASLGATASIASIVHYGVISLSYPLYTLFCDVTLSSLLFYRRRSMPPIERRVAVPGSI